MAETTAWRSHCQFITFITFYLQLMLFARWRHYFARLINTLWLDVQNELTLICAKFGKDLFNISKVTGRETKWPRFLAYTVG